MFPTVVVEGMLASIGLLIIAKELPHFLGVKFHAHEFYEYLLETPSAALHAQPKVVLSAASASACSSGWRTRGYAGSKWYPRRSRSYCSALCLAGCFNSTATI